MGYQTSYDGGNDILVLRVLGNWTADDARKFSVEAEPLLKGKPHRQLLVDLSKAEGLVGTEGRRVTAEELKRIQVTHMAQANARPAIRILGMILSKLIGGAIKNEFCSSTADAVKWLKVQRGEA